MILRIYGEDVVIEDGEVTCNNSLLTEMINEVLVLENQPPQKGYYPALFDYFSNIEVLDIEDEEDIVY